MSKITEAAKAGEAAPAAKPTSPPPAKPTSPPQPKVFQPGEGSEPEQPK